MSRVLPEDPNSSIPNKLLLFSFDFVDFYLLAWFPKGQNEFVDWKFEIVFLLVCLKKFVLCSKETWFVCYREGLAKKLQTL